MFPNNGIVSMVEFKRGKDIISKLEISSFLYVIFALLDPDPDLQTDPDPADIKECGSMRIWIRFLNTGLYPV
jgi:hypothetical protein